MKFHRAIRHLGCLALSLCGLISVIRAELGRPIIDHHGARQTGGSDMNWCAAQDERGVLYFGSDAVLRFDGERWSQHRVPGSYAVRSLSVGAGGRVWVAAVNEIGYFERTASGLSAYRSLLASLPENERTVGDVWHVFAREGGAVFVTTDAVLCWDGRAFTVHRLPGARRLPSVQVGPRIFISHRETGLWLLDGDRLTLFLPPALLPDTGISWVEPLAEGWLLVTSNGLFSYSNGAVTPFADETSAFVRSDVLTSVARLPNGDLCVGTLGSGLAIVDPKGATKRILTRDEGLQSNSVISSFVARDGSLWITSSTGIDRLSLTGGTSLFDANTGLSGRPSNSVAQSNGNLFVGTGEGIFRLPLGADPAARFQLIDATAVRAEALAGDETGLYAAGFKGVDHIGETGTTHIFATDLDVLLFHRARLRPGFFLLDGFEVVHLEPGANEGWTPRRIALLPDLATSLAEGMNGELWVGTQARGIFRIDGPSGSVPQPVTTEAGPTSSGFGLVARLGPAIALIHESKIELRTARGHPLRVLHAPAASCLAVSDTADPQGSLWLAFGSPFSDGHRIPFIGRLDWNGGRPSLAYFKCPGIDRIGTIYGLFVDDRGIVWIGGADGLLRLDPAEVEPLGAPTAPLLHASVANGGSIAADHNSVSFEFAALEYNRRESVRFQTLLSGSGETWSTPADENHLRLAGLRDGHYEFAVRVVNEVGLASPPATWRFTVLPPWYRTKTALAAWAFLVVAGCFGIIQWRSAYLTRRNLLLEELVRKKTDQLEKANAAKSDFLANMSHEIRNPISGIVGLSLAMEETTLDPRQRHLSDSIRSCASLLATLVDDVLDFSKIEAGRIDLRPAPFELRAALEQCRTMVAEEIRQRGGELTLDLAAGIPAQVVGDSGRIQQIVLNYLTNAVKFGGGQPIVLGALPREHGRIRLFVRDQGPGLSQAESAALFTKFTRLPDAQAKNIRGSGLGLAVCRLLATKMGGTVGVDSQLGAGSTFWADLPLPAANAPRPAVAESAAATPLRALIVEDIDYNATAMQAVLRKLGIESEVASDGLTAFEKLQATFYDVAFMDWNLPGMIGTEVVSRYRAVEPANRRTIIIATTAYSADFNREACLAAGMDAFIAKPFTPEKIGAALADLRGSLRAAASVSVRAPAPPAASPAAEFDLQMLRFLADESSGGLRAEIERYLAAVNTDREAAHVILATGNAPEIHRIAHRLVGHASAIKYDPLVRLARELQAHAATDDPARLHRLLAAFDAEFATLRKKLDSIRASTAPA